MRMFIVSKALLISSATVILRVGGIWLNPFATVLYTMCSVLCFVPVLRGVFGMLAVM